MRYPNAMNGIRRICLAGILNIASSAFGVWNLILLTTNSMDLNASGEVIAKKNDRRPPGVCRQMLYRQVPGRARWMR